MTSRSDIGRDEVLALVRHHIRAAQVELREAVRTSRWVDVGGVNRTVESIEKAMAGLGRARELGRSIEFTKEEREDIPF